MTRAAVLDRMSSPLCEAALDLPGSAATLAELAGSNMLLVPLDHRGAPQLPGKPRAATLSATLSHESNEADWNVGGPSTCLMS